MRMSRGCVPKEELCVGEFNLDEPFGTRLQLLVVVYERILTAMTCCDQAPEQKRRDWMSLISEEGLGFSG